MTCPAMTAQSHSFPAETAGHPYDASTYLDRLSPNNAKIAADLARIAFPNFDEQSRRIRARRMEQEQ